MAKVWREFKKYEESRKKTTRFLNNIHRKSVRDRKKLSRQREVARNKRMRECKREKQKREAAKQKTYTNTTHEPITFSGILLAVGALVLFGLFFVFWFKFGFWKSVWTTITLFFLLTQISDNISKKTFDIWGYVFVALLAITIILCFSMGFWWGLLAGIGVCAVAFVLYLLFSKSEASNETIQQEENDQDEPGEDKQLSHLHDILEEFDLHKQIINTSDDPTVVKTHLDGLLGVMDEIMTYDETLLRKAGMTKSTMPQQKQKVLELYDTMIEQAKEKQTNKE